MGLQVSVRRAFDVAEQVLRLHPAEVPARVGGALKHRLAKGSNAPRYVPAPEASDPIEALRRRGPGLPVLEVPLERLRPYALSVSVTDLDRNPFTRCVADHVAGRVPDYRSSVLWRYYERWQPSSLGEVFGAGMTAKADGLPVMPDCLPWHDGCHPASIRRGRAIHDRRMAALLGGGLAHGYRSFGPVSAVAGERFYADYTDVADSVVEIGYQADLGEQPVLEVLTDGERWVGRVLAGNHRAAVRAALGHESMAMAVRRKVIRRGEVGRWTGVRWGLYTRAQALAVFDAFLEGQPASGLPTLAPTPIEERGLR